MKLNTIFYTVCPNGSHFLMPWLHPFVRPDNRTVNLVIVNLWTVLKRHCLLYLTDFIKFKQSAVPRLRFDNLVWSRALFGMDHPRT